VAYFSPLHASLKESFRIKSISELPPSEILAVKFDESSTIVSLACGLIITISGKGFRYEKIFPVKSSYNDLIFGDLKHGIVYTGVS
jgi:hypothetical protein